MNIKKLNCKCHIMSLPLIISLVLMSADINVLPKEFVTFAEVCVVTCKNFNSLY